MGFVKSPFIADANVKLVLADNRIPSDMEENLRKRNIEIIKTPKCSDVYPAISGHPDISAFNCGYGDIIVCPNLYEEYKSRFNIYNINIIKGETVISMQYPEDIAYNVCIVGKYAIHNFKYTDKKVKEYIDLKGFEKIDIKQGYSKCSVCVVDENSIITSDKGIHREVLKYGIDSLLIEQGHIDLFEMNHGFIGGCSGIIDDDKIAFTGNIKEHPDFERIEEFLNKKNKEIISLGNERLIDLGSIIPIEVYD